MNLKLTKYLSICLLLAVFAFIEARAEGGDKDNTRNLNKVTGEPSYKRFNINNISTWVKNDGESDINPNGNSGLEFPKGSGKTAIFQSGFLWGGRVNDSVRVGGSVYRQGLVPGKITNSGVPRWQLTAENPGAAHVRNYRVRADINPNNPGVGDLSAEIADGEGTEAQIRTAYERDWNEWPAADGAPYEDLDGNGAYNPAVDIPGFPGADQTIWFVANDTDPAQTDFMYGSPPMGIEMQTTIWGYRRAGALGNMFFRSYKIINKSNTPFTDMYVSMWNDPDLGNAADDFVGCDTSLSITFVYNANASDQQYGQYPAAAGFDFFQGPTVDSPGDSAVFNGRRIYDKRNLPMTAHYFFINGDPIYSDPAQGVYATGTIQWYNLLRGRVGTTGQEFPDPITGETTTFALYGDPVRRTGWVDGLQHPPGDRRAGMASGPFTMAPGDTQEVVVAEIAAGGVEPIDRLTAVSLLKFYDEQAQIVYDNFFVVPAPPPAPQVTKTELNQKIILSWGSDVNASKATETFAGSGYEFQGYNIYQLPSRGATREEARRIATYDVVDGTGQIISIEFDPEIGVVGQEVTQFGNDTGIKRFIEITTDAFKSNLPLANGSRYFFAVTAYAFNGEQATALNVVENPIAVIEVVPQSTNPGVVLGGNTGSLQEDQIAHTGTADADLSVTVIDPTKLTGHQYEVFFDEQHYYLDAEGVWRTTNFADSIGKIGDVSPSSLVPMAVFGTAPGTIDLNLVLDLVSPTDAWVDGITLTFPAGTEILDAPVVEAGGGEVTPEITDNVIIYGLVNGDTTQNGVFHGGEVITITVGSFTPPFSVDYVIYDDGYPDPTVPMNAAGTAVVTEIGNYFVTQSHWNVRNVTTGNVVLADQTILNGQDIYAEELGPGGSTGSPFANVSESANVIFDGLLLSVGGSYAAPLSINSVNSDEAEGTYDIDDYTAFGFPSGRVSDALAALGVGTNSIDKLQQDYELRWTGETETITVDGQDVVVIKEGTGQVATVIQVSNSTGADFQNHPLNPDGSANPFTVRIPFEIYNLDTGEQVNVVINDRKAGIPGAENPYVVWKTGSQRMYAFVVNTPYAEEVINPATVADDMTWSIVFFASAWELGDVHQIFYANPLQLGGDTFTFTAPSAAAYSVNAAKEDVKRINVFPNPYYGVNSQEINKYQRFVTFSHLPEKATIRIFNLAGQLIRTIEKSTPDQFQRWDLSTDSGLPVASGLYVVYIDMPDIGETKILKAAIIQEQQVLDRF